MKIKKIKLIKKSKQTIKFYGATKGNESCCNGDQGCCLN